jgi:hypothetical protein
VREGGREGEREKRERERGKQWGRQDCNESTKTQSTHSFPPLSHALLLSLLLGNLSRFAEAGIKKKQQTKN